MIRYLRNFSDFLKPGLFPFSLGLFLILFLISYQAFNLPSPTELASIIISWFEKYGLRMLMIAAFIEGIFIIGMYFPGSLAIVLAVFSLGKSPLQLLYIGTISFFSFLLANQVNYVLGKYGYYRFLLFIGGEKSIQSIQRTLNSKGGLTFFLTGIFPNFLAITSVCAGISHLKYWKVFFLQSGTLFFWVTVWTIVGSLIVNKIDFQDKNQSFYLVLIFIAWGVILCLYKFFRKEKGLQ